MYGSLEKVVPVGGQLIITAPNEVSLTSGSLTCSIVIPANSGISGCSASSKVITVTLSRQLAADAFEIHIDAVITNPSSTTPTSSFSFETRSNTNTTLEILTTGIQLTATEGVLQSQSLTPQSQVVGTSTNLEVRFRPTHSMSTGGFIRVFFPKWNPDASNPTEYLTGAISCSTVAVLSSTLSCSFSNSVLIVSGAFGSTISGGIEVAFRVSGFRNPLSTSTVSGFQILTQDSTLGNIDRSSATLKISQAATIQSGSLAVDSSTSSSIAGIVQELNKMRLSFNSPVPLNQNCQVKVILPSQFSITTVNTVQIQGLFGSLQTVSLTKSALDNSFSFTSCSAYTSNNLAGLIIIDSLKLPRYNKQTSSLQIQLSNSNNDIIASVASGITFTASPGTLTTPAATAINPVILATTGLQITLTPLHSLDTTTKLIFTLPSTYALGNSCIITNLLNTNPSASCSVSGQQLVINSFLSSDFVQGSGSLLKFQVNDLTLPQTTQTQSGYAVSLQAQDSTDSQFYVVDTFSGSIPITINYGSLQAVITPSSLIAFDTAIYKFEITPDHFIPQNGYIKIKYPSDILISDSSFSQSQCSGFINFPTSPTCIIVTNSQEITIKNGFRLSTFPPGGTKFTFSIPGIRNPLSLSASSTFKIYTYSSNDQIMDQLESGITVTMTQTALMKSVLISLGSYVNGARTIYTFQITATVPVKEDNSVFIYFPPEVVLPTAQSQLNCLSDDTLIFNSIACTFNTLEPNSNSIKAVLDLRSNVAQINVLQTFKISVSNIKNPTSTKSTANFIVRIRDTSNNIINRSPDALTIATNTPYTLSKSSITANATGAGQPAKYTITIYPENDIQVGGGIYIVYPSQVGVISTSIDVDVTSSFTRSQPIVNFDRSARQILIRDAFQLKVLASASDNSITIVLNGFRNPLTNQASSSFVVKTFNEEKINGVSSYYYIDQVTEGLILNSLCDYPCATCQSGSPSICTSCYPTNTLNKLQGESCVSECSTGRFYNTKTAVCETCSYPCLGCNVSATNCTLCGYEGFLFLHNNTCGNSCPSGFVTDSTKNLCQRCSSECQSCDLTPQTCTSCFTKGTLPLLYQSTCLKTCPDNVSVKVGDVCQSCDTSCKTCAGTVNQCTSCLSHMKFDPVMKTCTSVCQSGTQIYDESKGVCNYCDNNCGTCSGTLTTCTSCKSDSVLNSDNVCRAQCNSLDQTPLDGVCKQCELPCSQCKGSISRCTKCQGDYLLYNTTCVQYCPDKFEPDEVTRQCILVGLICPSGFRVNEAGDGCIPNEFECPEGQIINEQRTACVPAPGAPVPFPFLFFSIMLSLLVLGSYIKDKFFTKIYSNLIALLSLQEMLMYILMLAYSGANGVWGAFVLSLVAVLTQMSANIMFYLLYKRDILKDEVFAKWQRSFPKTSKYIPLISLCVNFKVIRLFYSGFYGLESCLAQFEDPMKNLFVPLRMITYFNYIFVYVPIIIADIIIFAQVKWGYQLLVLGIETFLLIPLIIILTYFEFKHPQKLTFQGDESYSRIKPKSFANDTLVMGGMIDVDESTLIRTKVVDDDYEIFLRKKAFVSILNQVGKNYFTAQEKGIDMGGKIDQVMSKFDESRLKLRRAFSLEEIKEEDASWYIPSDDEEDVSQRFGQTKLPISQNQDIYVDSEEEDRPRRHSFPLSPYAQITVIDPQFKKTLQEIKQAIKEQLVNNVYAECKAPDRNKDTSRRKTVSRRTQTYLRELLQMDGEDLQESDLEIIMEDEAEIEFDYAQGLIDGVIDGISESESNYGGKKRSKKKRKNLNPKRTKEIPDFELADIMGDFEIDDLGNFIILRGEKGELLDKKERRVNRRGYLVDRFGNIINKQGQVIFKALELDSDDEIPAPFGFEKRKKNLLNLGADGEFKVEGDSSKQGPLGDDDEDLIDKELRQIKKKKGDARNQDIVHEEGRDDEDSSSVDSLMAESPGKYQNNMGNEDDFIANITKKKVPVKRSQRKNKQQNQKDQAQQQSPQQQEGQKRQPLQNLPPKRIKREDTKEMFPQLAIEASEQKKLFKIAEQIGGMASQIAQSTEKKLQESTISQQQQNINQERLERLKQEHFKDIIGNAQAQKQHTSEKKLPPRPNIDKIYGNLNDVVTYEEQLLKEQQKALRAQSPFSSQMTTRMAFRPETSAMDKKRGLRGLESIYLQKFDKRPAHSQIKAHKAKFRNTLQQFVDDPELLLDDGGFDRQRQNEMSMMVAEKLDRLQKQYMSNTSGAGSFGIPTVGAIRKNGSLNGSMFHHDSSLEPVKKGNWVKRD